MKVYMALLSVFVVAGDAEAKGQASKAATVLEAPEFRPNADGSSELVFGLRGGAAEPSLSQVGPLWQVGFSEPLKLGHQAQRPLLTEAFGGGLVSVRTTHHGRNVTLELQLQPGLVPSLRVDPPSNELRVVHVAVPAWHKAADPVAEAQK